MSTKLTGESFLSLVKQSGLVDQDQLKKLWKEFKEQGLAVDDSKAIADEFVNRNVLTRWQVDKLLLGKHKGFFLGKYRLLSHLGTGGMSSVYLAEHVLMRRRVAIKVLPQARVDDTSYLQRFHREAQAVAALDHRNIVRAYDVDQENKLHFLVMEYVAGQSLQELVARSGKVDFVHAAEYIRQAAEGLAHAHRAGMVHRDIKPGNLLVDEKGTVRLLDLGLARFFDDKEENSLTIKHDEKVLGTADYLAPEQALDSHTVDIRADIYSLGCTLYFILTGHPPFPEGTLAQRLMAHQTKQPASMEIDRPDIPASLVEIVNKMMEKQADDRYQTARDTSNALLQWLMENGGQTWAKMNPMVGHNSSIMPGSMSMLPDPNLALQAGSGPKLKPTSGTQANVDTKADSSVKAGSSVKQPAPKPPSSVKKSPAPAKPASSTKNASGAKTPPPSAKPGSGTKGAAPSPAPAAPPFEPPAFFGQPAPAAAPMDAEPELAAFLSTFGQEPSPSPATKSSTPAPAPAAAVATPQPVAAAPASVTPSAPKSGAVAIPAAPVAPAVVAPPPPAPPAPPPAPVPAASEIPWGQPEPKPEAHADDFSAFDFDRPAAPAAPANAPTLAFTAPSPPPAPAAVPAAPVSPPAAPTPMPAMAVAAAPIAAAPVAAAPVAAAPVVPAPITVAPMSVPAVAAAPVAPMPVVAAPIAAAPVAASPVASAPIPAAPVMSAPIPAAQPAPVASQFAAAVTQPVAAAPVAVMAAPVAVAAAPVARMAAPVAAPMVQAAPVAAIAGNGAPSGPMTAMPVNAAPTAPVAPPRKTKSKLPPLLAKLLQDKRMAAGAAVAVLLVIALLVYGLSGSGSTKGKGGKNGGGSGTKSNKGGKGGKSGKSSNRNSEAEPADDLADDGPPKLKAVPLGTPVKMFWYVGAATPQPNDGKNVQNVSSIPAALAQIKQIRNNHRRSKFTIRVPGGQTYTDPIEIDESYPQGLRIIADSPSTLSPAGGGPAITVRGGDRARADKNENGRVYIENFRIDGGGSREVAISLSGWVMGLHLKGIEVNGFTKAGILADGLQSYGTEQDLITLDKITFRGSPQAAGVILKKGSDDCSNIRLSEARFLGPLATGVLFESQAKSVYIAEGVFASTTIGVMLAGENQQWRDIVFSNNTFYQNDRGIVIANMPASGSTGFGYYNNLFLGTKGFPVSIEKDMNDLALSSMYTNSNATAMAYNWTDSAAPPLPPAPDPNKPPSPTDPKPPDPNAKSPIPKQIRIFDAYGGRWEVKDVQFVSTDPANADFLVPTIASVQNKSATTVNAKKFKAFVGARQPK